MPYARKEDKAKQMREYRARKKEELSNTINEIVQTTKEQLDAYRERVKQQTKEKRLKTRVWQEVWNEEVLKRRAKITETHTVTCPYCDDMPPLVGSTYTTFIALIEHLQSHHPEQFKDWFRNYLTFIKTSYDRAEEFFKNAEARETRIFELEAARNIAIKFVESYQKIANAFAKNYEERQSLTEMQNIRIENLEASQRGRFKSIAPSLNIRESSSDEYYQDPRKTGFKKEKEKKK